MISNFDLQRAITNVPYRTIESVGCLHRNPWFPALVFMATRSHPVPSRLLVSEPCSNFRFSSCCPSPFNSLKFLDFHSRFFCHYLLSTLLSFYVVYRTKQIQIQYFLIQLKMWLSSNDNTTLNSWLWHPSFYDRVMVFNGIFTNISVISFSFIGGEAHRPVASHWQTLPHNVVSSTHRKSGIRSHNVNGYIYWLPL